MAKTVVAMLVGIAIAEGSIKSINDQEKYVPELKGAKAKECRKNLTFRCVFVWFLRLALSITMGTVGDTHPMLARS